jgi:hypothetical protein
VYALGGIALASEIPLPELEKSAEEADSRRRATIRLGHVPARIEGAVELDPDCFATPSQFLLRIPGIGRYLVSGGSEIVVEPEANAPPLDLRAYLLSAAFIVLCQQRGLLPLHASAVSSGGEAVAFLAPSGQGKSSVAAHLARRGLRVLSDDICLVNADEPPRPMAIPAAPWLKLWRHSLQELGWGADGLERVFSADDKYRFPLDDPRRPEPIGKLLFLERGEDGIDNRTHGGSNDGSEDRARTPEARRHGQVEFRKLTRAQTVPLLMALTHQAYLLQATGQRDRNFLQCSRVAASADAWRLIRPWGLAHMEETIDAIEDFVRGR